MKRRTYAIGFALATLPVLVAPGAAGAAASPADAASNAGPALEALDGVGVIDSPAHHCGPDESHVDPFYCIYNPPCDGTCVEVAERGGAYVR